MTILDAIRDDHDEIRSLLRELLETADEDGEKRTDLIHQIKDVVIPHARAEEAVLYNSMRKADAPTDMVYHGFAEHAETEVLLHTLVTTNAVDVGWKAVAQKLHDSLIHHVDEEESDLFPQAQEAFSEEQLEAMAEEFLAKKPEVREQSTLKNSLELFGNLIQP